MKSPNLKRVLTICTFFLSTITQGQGQDFGYDGSNGPTHWGEKFQHCVGKHQSPINIEEHNVQLVNLQPMIFGNFDWKPNAVNLKNNGHTVVFTLQTDKTPAITGGPLIGNYDFAQFHFHWGANDYEGSENTINNSSFPLELHMVFYQRAYGSFEEATEHPDGLTVLAFLYSNEEKDNENYSPLLNALPLVQDPHTTTNVTDMLPLKDLVPEDLSVYFTYGGSLTTPPCSEVVTWIEFKNTVSLTHKQLELFRQLNSEHGKLLHNFRPVQPLHGRTIRLNRDIKRLKLNKNDNRDRENSLENVAFNLRNYKFSLLLTFLLVFLRSR